MKYALTGGIGSGKSYVCRLLREYGIDVYDCDAAAKRLMRSDGNLQQRLSKTVGQNVFPDGNLDKPLLAAFLLASEDNNRIVNSIVHPAVADDFLRSGKDWMESAILFESGFNRFVDKVVCISAPLDVRLDRIVARDGISCEKALEWINRQMSQHEKEQLSDFVILNDGKTDLRSQIKRLLGR